MGLYCVFEVQKSGYSPGTDGQGEPPLHFRLYPNETLDDADRRLAAFTKEIVPVLKEYLPK